MIPERLDSFENGEAGLDIYLVGDQKKYWVKGGVGAIEFDEEGFDHLLDLLASYDEDQHPPKTRMTDNHLLVLIGSFIGTLLFWVLFFLWLGAFR